MGNYKKKLGGQSKICGGHGPPSSPPLELPLMTFKMCLRSVIPALDRVRFSGQSFKMQPGNDSIFFVESLQNHDVNCVMTVICIE